MRTVASLRCVRRRRAPPDETQAADLEQSGAVEQVDALNTDAIPDDMEIAAIIPPQLSSEDLDAGICRTQAESAEPAVCLLAWPVMGALSARPT